MRQNLHCRIDDSGLARVVLDVPPLNAITPELRLLLAKTLGDLPGRGARAVVLSGAGRGFSAGVRMGELDAPDPAEPTLCDLARLIENTPIPVVAALHGAVLGAGCELALAAHARIAAPGAHLALPGIKLGLVPEAGATQILPRLMGAGPALAVLLVGQPVSAEEALRLGMIDRLAEGDLGEAAAAFALELADGAVPVRRIETVLAGASDPAAFAAAVAQARAGLERAGPKAPGLIVDCVEAAQLLTFEAGLAREAAARDDALADPAGQGLRHLFRAERQVARPANALKQQPRQIGRVRLLGAGRDAAGWALLLARHGIAIETPDETAGALQAAITLVAPQGAPALERPGDQPPDMVLAAGLAFGDLPEGAIALQDLPTGRRFSPGELPHPERSAAVQLTDPPETARLVELLLDDGTAPEVSATLVNLFRKLGLIVVVSPAREGGIGGAVWGACLWASDHLVRSGCPPETVTAALGDAGFAKLPYDTRTPPATGQGPARGEDEIVGLICAAAANAGILLLEAGAARRASDIDLVMVHGHGFPALRGGPMFQAGRIGLLRLRRMLEAEAGASAAAGQPEDEVGFWLPAPLLPELIKNGLPLETVENG